MFTARNLVVNTFQTTLVYGIAAALYLAICIPLSRAIRRLGSVPIVVIDFNARV
jgi:ABC-type amino acid transport system permease subunit